MMRNFVSVFLIVSGIPAWAVKAGDARPFTTWSQYLGGADSSQYSALRQINKSNVARLEVAWTYPTGARDPRGGPVVTAGGLIFAATASDHKIRAYDEDTGKVLWEYETPTGSDGVPAVYEAGGREYIAFCAAGGDGLNLGGRGRGSADAAPPPSAYMVFALPR